MKKRIELDWPILPGSISTAMSQCGKDGCGCKKKRSPRLHGTYYRWTGFIDGKRTTKTISKEQRSANAGSRTSASSRKKSTP